MAVSPTANQAGVPKPSRVEGMPQRDGVLGPAPHIPPPMRLVPQPCAAGLVTHREATWSVVGGGSSCGVTLVNDIAVIPGTADQGNRRLCRWQLSGRTAARSRSTGSSQPTSSRRRRPRPAFPKAAHLQSDVHRRGAMTRGSRCHE